MLTVIEKVLLLQDLDLFQFAYTEHLARIAGISRDISVNGNTILFREGEPGGRLHLLLKGSVVLEAEGRRCGPVSSGALDCWSFFSDQPYRFTARALEDCTLLTVSYEDMVDLLTGEPELCWAILKRLAHRERDTGLSEGERNKPGPPPRTG
jgi:CRP-like cAMP-binding protein